MRQNQRIEDLRIVWGPPPTEPSARSVWEHGMELLSELPEAVSSLVEKEGTTFTSIEKTFSSLLPRLERDVTLRFLMVRVQEDLRDAVLEVLREQPWEAFLFGYTPLQRTRTAYRLSEDVNDNISRIILMEPRFRSWLLGD